jgi:hypothetical protein
MVVSIILILPWISLRFTSGKCKVNCAVGLIQAERRPGPRCSLHSEEMAGSRARWEVLKSGGSGTGLKSLARQQTGQAFPGDAPGAAAPFDPGDPAVTNHPVDGAAGDHQNRCGLIWPEITLLI